MVEYINFHTVAAFLNALMLGAMSCFTLALAPVVFRALEREQAVRLLSSLFPLYYPVLLVCATAAALLIFYRWESWASLGRRQAVPPRRPGDPPPDRGAGGRPRGG